MTSAKLEDSLSLLPDAQRHWFEHRNKHDVVVVYDSTSTSWPKTNAPLSRLWDIIYEHEFGKKLQRMPVLLIGGHEHWTEFVRRRQVRATPGSASGSGKDFRTEKPQANGHAHDVRKWDVGVYQPYVKNVSDNVSRCDAALIPALACPVNVSADARDGYLAAPAIAPAPLSPR